MEQRAVVIEASPAPKRPVCHICGKEMIRVEPGHWRCPDGHCEVFVYAQEEVEIAASEKREPPPIYTHNWLGMPLLACHDPSPVTLLGGYAARPGRGGGSRSRGKSPAKQKMEAWLRREAPGRHARRVRFK